jgi:hypothetical protein
MPRRWKTLAVFVAIAISSQMQAQPLLHQRISGDYDGDGKTDLAVYRGGTWMILLSSTGKEVDIPFGGAANDIPVAADYDGDGKTDPAVYRGGMWMILLSSTGKEVDMLFGGAANDIPVAADYDGDGRADIAVYRGGWWYIQQSSLGYFERSFGGAANDVPVAADYDGDGRADIAVYRGGWWYIQQSSLGYFERSFGGAANDIPVAADYDGDGRADIAVYRGGWWYIQQSSLGYFEKPFGGAANDIPVSAPIRTGLPPTTPTPPASTTTYSLSVSGIRSNGPQGGVKSSPAGINCPLTCTASFPAGSTVVLTATPLVDYIFSGWTGDCHGQGTATVILNRNSVCGVIFTFSGPQ